MGAYEAWQGFGSIIAIIATVVVGAGLIAFLVHMILGVFDNNKQATKKEEKGVIDYAQFKQLENAKSETAEKDYDFEAINESKAQKEKEMLETELDTIFDLEEDKDQEMEEIENRIKETEEVESEETQEEIEEVKEELTEVEDDEFDLDNMLSEISEEIIEEEKAEQNEEVKISDELASYSIDDLLREAEENQEAADEELTETEEVESTEDVEEVQTEEEIVEAEEEIPSYEIIDEIVAADEDDANSVDETLVEEPEEEIEETVEETIEEAKPEVNEEVESLKAQLAELNRQLELARSANNKVEVVRIDMTEEECVARLETLEERLKNVRKQYKTNSKEYRPLKKVMNDLEKYQTKLRRKETVVAKKKVSLYGVNNYVDIDKEKAEKLANELELLDGLRLSVSHCEEVINANKDRFPILEHTNQILEDQIANIEADIESTKLTLQKIREQNGNGEGTNE